MLNDHFLKTYNKFKRVDKMLSKNLAITGKELELCIDKQKRRMAIIIEMLESELRRQKISKENYSNNIQAERDREYCMKNYDQLLKEDEEHQKESVKDGVPL